MRIRSRRSACAIATRFEGDPTKSVIYRGVSDGLAPPGIEFYLPLFFDTTDTLLDYLPPDTVVCAGAELAGAVEHAARSIAERYEERRHDVERPVLAPDGTVSVAGRAAGAARHVHPRSTTKVSRSKTSCCPRQTAGTISRRPRRRNGAWTCAPNGRWRRSRISSPPTRGACCWPRIPPAAAKCCSRCCGHIR